MILTATLALVLIVYFISTFALQGFGTVLIFRTGSLFGAMTNRLYLKYLFLLVLLESIMFALVHYYTSIQEAKEKGTKPPKNLRKESIQSGLALLIFNAFAYIIWVAIAFVMSMFIQRLPIPRAMGPWLTIIGLFVFSIVLVRASHKEDSQESADGH